MLPSALSRGTNGTRAQFALPAKSPTPASQPAVRLGPWLLEELLGEGALARVFRARVADSNDSRPGQYAIKLLNERWHDDPLALDRLRNEAIVGRAVSHPHVIPVLDAHVHRPPYYLVMPLLPGRSVVNLLATRRRLSVPTALWIARQTSEALAALHAAGYAHGDIKPANLMLSPAGHVTLLDLGCARRIDEEAALAERPLQGTPDYWAPELFTGGQAEPRTDLYSLGIVLFQMLAGRLPLLASSLAELAAAKRVAALPGVRCFAPGVPSEVAQIVREMTARDPLRRPQQARDLIRRLMALEVNTLGLSIPA